VSNSLKRNTKKDLSPSIVFINNERTHFESKSQRNKMNNEKEYKC